MRLPCIAALLLTSAAAAPELAIDPARLREHVAVLASDDFQGRKAGGPADRKSTDYIADAFAKAGLKPGGPEQGWLQRVPLETRAARGWRLTAEGERGRREIPLRNIVLLGDKAEITLFRAPVIFIGYGLIDPITGRDNLAGVDVRGAILLRLGTLPQEYRKAGRPTLSTAERQAHYHKLGAVGELSISDANAVQFASFQQAYVNGVQRLQPEGDGLAFSGLIQRGEAARLFGKPPGDLERLIGEAADPAFKPRQMSLRLSGTIYTRVSRDRSNNVLGLLAGSGQTAETVIFTAHWDGYGVCRPAGTPDRICNGAIDNASGVAGLIELAHAFAHGPKTRRNLLFVATTAEEAGLLGAEYFVRNPVLPLSDIVGGINLDTIALRPRGAKVALVGRGLTNLDPIVMAEAAAQGREILDDPSVQQYFARSDQYVLARRGVPVVMLTGIFSRQQEKDDPIDLYFAQDYHQPSDELRASLNFDGAAEDAALAFRVGTIMANSADRPEWLSNSPYQRVQGR